MMMMCDIGNFGVTALQQQSLLQLSIILLLLLLLLLHQQKEGIFLSSVVRIKPYFWIWSQCVAVMYQSRNLITNHFSGKSRLLYSLSYFLVIEKNQCLLYSHLVSPYFSVHVFFKHFLFSFNKLVVWGFLKWSPKAFLDVFFLPIDKGMYCHKVPRDYYPPSRVYILLGSRQRIHKGKWLSLVNVTDVIP